MTTQRFKTLYFSDHPDEDSSRRNLKLAFGPKDQFIFEALAGYTSCELRTLLGTDSLQELRATAKSHDVPVNKYCMHLLRRWYDDSKLISSQLTLPTFDNLGIYSTYRAGRQAPLQRWYPWLEGYSPDFVSQILAQYAPSAQSVFDPFAGSGTTPITAASQGLRTYYSELNPLLQFLVETKTHALLLTPRERRKVSEDLLLLADRFDREIESQSPDQKLLETYRACFGVSEFFDVDTLDEVLQARTLLDQLACMDQVLANFASVAVVASLVPASRLKRAGDLRFRRGSETNQLEEFKVSVAARLRVIAEDVAASTLVPHGPVLLAGDARKLESLPPLGFDIVVTSPPYLNGTNYFRNTKLELWFLRCLRKPADLAAFRMDAVTAGINDVTRGKPMSTNDAVAETVLRLERNAYDRRIPQMVGNYFYDMERVLLGLARHASPGAVVAIDIGDSAYAGERVATDVLLTSIAETLGFSLTSTVLLRNRVSRDSSPLKQVLLLFEYQGRRCARPVAPWRQLTTPNGNSINRWSGAWGEFKKHLPHHDEPYSKRNWGHPLHSLCSYQGKMKPALAHFLVKAFVPKGGRMLDPFTGVGTIPFEAALQGATSFGFDISPSALPIAGAKVARHGVEHVALAVADLEDFMATGTVSRQERSNALKLAFNSSLDTYFHKKTFREVLLARKYYQQFPPATPAEMLVFSCLLHILHGNRPYALSRRSHPITPFAPTGAPQYKPLVAKLREKVFRSLEVSLPEEFEPGMVFETDATAWWPAEVTDLDAIITSPPFYDSTRFYLANWMRLWFAGWERSDFDRKPKAFVDERQKDGFRVYEPVFRQARERLKQGGAFVMHLGISRKCDMAARMQEIATPWFRVADLFTESVEHCESHGISDKGTVTSHQFLVLH